MRTQSPRFPVRTLAARERSRFRYDQRRWGRDGSPGWVEESYWSLTRRPVPSLTFLLPVLLTYELGAAWLGGGRSGMVRTGVDAWIRQGLAGLGLTNPWLPPMGLVLALLGWQVWSRGPWRIRPVGLLGMALESVGLALALIGLSRLVDLGLSRLDQPGPWLAAETSEASARALAMLGYLGAGVYEEAIFRLALLPLAHGLLRLLMTPRLLAGILAVTGSAWLFAIAHHVGLPGEPFTWYAFFFRWVAGVYFAWVFVVRGFGIAVGTHAAYDLLVGWLTP